MRLFHDKQAQLKSVLGEAGAGGRMAFGGLEELFGGGGRQDVNQKACGDGDQLIVSLHTLGGSRGLQTRDAVSTG